MIMSSPNTTLRLLPSVDALLKTATASRLISRTGPEGLSRLARQALDELRSELQAAGTERPSREGLIAAAEERMSRIADAEQRSGLQRVINATGVMLHTNLGRAPLSQAARRAIAETAAGYCTLEYDLASGRRGRRGARTEQLLAQLTGAGDALVVNNCAAAALLVLTVFASDGETIMSRGELVEIGGDFRVPDVMSQSGARLVEVGTTNRTRLSDYVKAINEQTRLIMRVHPSNYRIIGFTATPSLDELAELARNSGLPIYEDAGSGALVDLTAYGLGDEPVISDSIKAGVDIVTFSGDKLLGSAQAGLIVGKQEYVERLRMHPLYRALRADKLVLAALEATLAAYSRDTQFEEVPLLAMLSADGDDLAKRAEGFAARINASGNVRAALQEGESAIGGGSGPTTHPKTTLIALTSENLSAAQIEAGLRAASPPVISRILDDRVLLDLRTVFPEEEDSLLDAVREIGRS
jgi:L-seryl-tRNA(Ser) seleniumtransferase